MARKEILDVDFIGVTAFRSAFDAGDPRSVEKERHPAAHVRTKTRVGTRHTGETGCL